LHSSSVPQVVHAKVGLQISPVGQFVAVRHSPSTHPPEMQRCPLPYCEAQIPSSPQGMQVWLLQTFPSLHSDAFLQFPVMQTPLSQM
jgi:hypothetical protein